jgi:hypothetical protein
MAVVPGGPATLPQGVAVTLILARAFFPGQRRPPACWRSLINRTGGTIMHDERTVCTIG